MWQDGEVSGTALRHQQEEYVAFLGLYENAVADRISE